MKQRQHRLSFLQFLEQLGVLNELEASEIGQQTSRSRKTLYSAILAKSNISKEYLTALEQSYDKQTFVDLRTIKTDQATMALISESLAKKYTCLPFRSPKGQLMVAVKNPLDTDQISLIQNYMGEFGQVVVADAKLIQKKIAMSYRKTDLINRLFNDILINHKKKIKATVLQSQEQLVNTLIDTILSEASQLEASDIHFECDDTHIYIRQRIDGDLFEESFAYADIYNVLIRGIKIKAELDIFDSDQEIDGALMVTINDQVINARLSIMPTTKHPSVVIRILGTAEHFSNMSRFVNSPTILKNINQFLGRQFGMMLVTGPTGSGKSSVLYSALMHLNNGRTKIISIEDPVETKLPRINQIEVNDNQSMGFANILRASLRQDPDVIMIGEIRDEETANIAMRASMTGHLVLATLHTKSVLSTISRLVNLNVPTHLLCHSINLIISQRLVRKNCPHCVEPDTLNPEQHEALEDYFKVNINKHQFSISHGCEICRGTGFAERQGVYESLSMNHALETVLSTGDLTQLEPVIQQQLMHMTLQDNALSLALSGTCRASEVIALLG